MNYQLVPIGKISADPLQPRQYFNENALKEMAVSVKNEGIINPIEVDENFVIITGERRWRASKLAGLKEIPARVLAGLSPDKRFIRQVQENLHQNTMSAWDTALALDKTRKLICSPGEQIPKRGVSIGDIWGITELARLFGKEKSYYSEMLSLLAETGEMREALKDPSFQRTKLREITDFTPKKYHEGLRHVVATQKKITRDTVRHLATALSRADKYGEEEKAKKLLKENFDGLSTLEALTKINKIVPDEESRVKEPADAVKFISEKVIDFMELLEEHPLKSFDDVHRTLAMRDLTALGFYLQNYLQGKSGKDMIVGKKTKMIQ